MAEVQTASLKRSLTLTLVTLYGLGTIIGAGIYVLIGKVAGHAGMFTPLAFLVAALIVTPTAFTYAELSSRFPVSAGEAVYADKAFRRRWFSFLMGIFLILIGSVSTATLANGFVGYFLEFLQLPEWLIITSVVLLCGGLSAWGINESVGIASMLTLLEVAGLLIIMWVARDVIDTPSNIVATFSPDISGAIWAGILLGGFLAFYAFIGFEDMVNIAEEVKQVEKTMPRAIILALIISTLLYMAIAVVAVLSMDPQTLAKSNAPLASIYRMHTEQPATLITIIGLFSILNGVLIQIIKASRVVYGMARRQWLPHIFAQVHPFTRTPLWATLATTLLVLLLALGFDLETLAKTTSFITLCIFTIMHIALIVIKRRDTGEQIAVSYPIWVPVVGFILSSVFLFSQFML